MTDPSTISGIQDVGGVDRSERVGLFLIPEFSMLSLTAVVEPLRMANRLSQREFYRWFLLADADRPVSASNGLPFHPSLEQDRARELDMLLVVAGIDAHLRHDPGRTAWLRRLAGRGLVLGATSTGSLLLARAGLLDGYRCTIHWENHAALREEFPDLKVSAELYEIDGRRLTCSGGTAGLDMMLHLIGRRHGLALANAVAEQCIHPKIRQAGESQRMTVNRRLAISHPRLLAVIVQMESHLEQLRSCEAMADSVGLSLRQLERLFQRHFDTTPGRFYMGLRLERARMLVLQTSLSILEVAAACGFVSASHFARCYREAFGKTPREERTRAAAG